MTPDDRHADSTGDPEGRADGLVDEIEATRDDMTETVRAIGEKLDPANVIQGAKETVRGATVGKVEQMTTGAQETWSDVRRGDASGLLDTITRNPIPTAMVAIGLGLLFMRRAESGDTRRTSYRGRGSSAYGFGDRETDRGDWYGGWRDERDEVSSGAAEGLRSAVSDRASDVRERFEDVTDQAGETASRVGRRVSEGASAVPDMAGDFMEAGGSQASRLFDENPLAVGVVALAAGAAAALLIPATQPEREMLGPAREKMLDRASTTLDRAMTEVEAQAKQATGQSAST